MNHFINNKFEVIMLLNIKGIIFLEMEKKNCVTKIETDRILINH